MNKKTIKRIAVAGISLSLAVLPLFAHGHSRNWDHDFRQEHCPAPMPYGGFGMANPRGGAVVQGTVSAVNTKTETITVTNADGENVVVHISPVTRVMLDDGNTPVLRAQGTRMPDTFNAGEVLEKVKNGNYVFVSVFDSGTKTLEASRVFIMANN